MPSRPYTLNVPSASTSVIALHAANASNILLVNARALMHSRLGEHGLTLKEVAACLFISSRQLQRTFAAAGSPGFRHELASMRVREAAHLIYEHPDLSIAAVAIAVGYRQPPYFAKTFREQLGKSPGVWRRHCQQLAAEASYLDAFELAA